MKSENARILVIGAGVNGSACAAVLRDGGIDVTVLARGKRYKDILNEGIIIEDQFKNKRIAAKVKVINTLSLDDLYDYILVIVRKNQVGELLPVLAKNKSPNVVFLGNTLAGPDQYTKHLGRERVMLGIADAFGIREGNIISAKISRFVAVLGEIDGAITPRLTRLTDTLRLGGFKAIMSTCILDFLMTHAAVVTLFGKLTIRHGHETRAIARSAADLGLLINAMRESFAVLEALGYRIVPASQSLIRILPRFVLVAFLRVLLFSRLAEVGLAYHISQAPDEINHLARELQVLVESSGLPAPSIRKVLSMES